MRIKEILNTAAINSTITAEGWVKTKRELKGFSFIEISDGSTMNGLQVIIDGNLADYEAIIKKLNTGAAVTATGLVVESPGKGQRIELQAKAVTVHGEADPETYPLQKKRHSFEFLRTIGHLRGKTNTMGAVMRVRNACATAIHQFFQERGFIWAHTPIITASDCEGAGEMFAVTNFDLANPKRTKEGAVDYAEDFFGRPAYLTVSGQLEAEVMAMAFKDVYTFGPTFRAENSNTSRHLAEFWMVEPEMAFCDIVGDQDLAEEFLRYIFKYVLEACPEDMEFFNKRIDNSVLATAQNIIENEFARITYTEAIALLEKSNKTFEFPVEWGSISSQNMSVISPKTYLKSP